MPDMLVKLYDLPEVTPEIVRLQKAGISIRRALAPEDMLVMNWVRQHFSERRATSAHNAL